MNEKMVKLSINEYENIVFILSIQETIDSDYSLISIKFIRDFKNPR